MNHNVAPLYELLNARRQELGLSWSDVAERCGYRNRTKGLRRLSAIWEGDLWGKASMGILSSLPKAIALGRDEIHAAIKSARSRILHESEKTMRAAFLPSAYLLGTETRPSQITIYGVTGGAQRWLRIPLDLSQPPITFAKQALAVVRRTPSVPFFGPTKGFIINYTPDVAVQFDSQGNPEFQLPHAYTPGGATFSIRRRVTDINALQALLGVNMIDPS